MSELQCGWPDRAQAERLVAESVPMNPGPWGDHCRAAAQCAERIACRCGMDPEKAYVLALLHDIGRRFGVRHMGHIWDGWQYMLSMGWPDAARICLTHSFPTRSLNDYVGCSDVTPEQEQALAEALAACDYDDYDRLVILCDTLAGPGVILDMEERMDDVARRYGRYPDELRQANRALRRYFEDKMGMDIDEAVRA